MRPSIKLKFLSHRLWTDYSIVSTAGRIHASSDFLKCCKSVLISGLILHHWWYLQTLRARMPMSISLPWWLTIITQVYETMLEPMDSFWLWSAVIRNATNLPKVPSHWTHGVSSFRKQNWISYQDPEKHWKHKTPKICGVFAKKRKL